MTATDVKVRPATAADAAAIAAIYNQGIRARIATFETEERGADERRAWLAAHDERHPVLVATVAGSDDAECVVGWAAADHYRSRACYAGVAEFSIYVDESARGRGVGVLLLQGLIDAAEQAGLWKLLSRVFPENTASRSLCARLGFREVGTYEKHARLDGVWRDVVIVERLIPANLT
jgi:phosphinothricin acetyltransferase